MISITSLFSGSSGNSILVSSGNTNILVDAGSNCKSVCNALATKGISLNDINAIFVTHDHSDHISALNVMSHKNPKPIHISESSAHGCFREMKYAYDNAVIHSDSGYSERVGNIVVTAFQMPHDTESNFGIHLEDIDGDRACICLDMGYVTNICAQNITGVRQAVIEANHDINMLKNNSYPAMLKQRILSNHGHLSNDVCALLAVHLAKNGVEKLLLAHLSTESNTHDLALSCVRNALDSEGFDNVEVKIARRYQPSDL